MPSRYAPLSQCAHWNGHGAIPPVSPQLRRVGVYSGEVNSPEYGFHLIACGNRMKTYLSRTGFA